jgi:hypothetical protein
MKNNDIGPPTILSKAIEAVPAIRYALGLAGVAAAVAIILGFISSIKIAFFGIVFTVALMVVLVVFSHIVQDLPGKRWMAALLSWVIILLFSAVLIVTFTSFAFGIPERLVAFWAANKTASKSTDESQPDLTKPLEDLPNDARSKLKPVQDPILLDKEKGKVEWQVHNDSDYIVKEVIMHVSAYDKDFIKLDARDFQLYLSSESSGEPHKTSKYIGEFVFPPKYEKEKKYYGVLSAKGIKK